MNSQILTRRRFSLTLTSLLSGLGLRTSALAASRVSGPGGDRISHTEEAIHQEVTLKAGRKRVYEALTETDQFQKATGVEGTKISHELGGAFTLFGGAIEGRQVELVPAARIVQAWRASAWETGKYSIARFELKDEGAGTRIVFEHTGFPKGQAEHLASGWQEHYWDSLTRYFGD
jgi:activator of HSP90 ATPase